jgi:hypothetical protein
MARKGEGGFEAQRYLQAQNVPVDLGTASRVAAGDLTGDGVADLVATGDSGSLVWFEGRRGRPLKIGPGQSLPTRENEPLQLPASADGAPLIPALGDLDGDGDLDLLVCGPDVTMQVSLNVGTRSRPLWSPLRGLTSPGLPQSARLLGVVLEDWDQDGLPDLFAGMASSVQGRGSGPELSGLATFENRGERGGLPRWEKGARLIALANERGSTNGSWDITSALRAPVGILDWNGDRERDFLVETVDDELWALRNLMGPGQYPRLALDQDPRSRRPLARYVQHAVAGDLNGDGVPDIICGMDRYGFLRAYDGSELRR